MADKIESDTQSRRILGHTFRPFTRSDGDCFGGAEPGSLICYVGEDTTLILAPDGTVSEIVWPADAENGVQKDWQVVREMET